MNRRGYGLCDTRILHSAFRGILEQLLKQVPRASTCLQTCSCPLHTGRKSWPCAQQALAHPRILGTLAAENEADARGCLLASTGDGLVGQFGKLRNQVIQVRGNKSDPMLHDRPPAQGVGKAVQQYVSVSRIRLALEILGHIGCHLLARLLAGRAENKEPFFSPGSTSKHVMTIDGWNPFDPACCLHQGGIRGVYNDVGVGSAITEAIHRNSLEWLRLESCWDSKLEVVQVNVRVRFLEIDLRRNHVVFEHQDGLDQTGETGCTLSMTNVGLDRADG